MEKQTSGLSSDQLLRKLAVILSNQSSTALFACGGAVLIGASPGQCQPVAIRWDSPQSVTSKLVLPARNSGQLHGDHSVVGSAQEGAYESTRDGHEEAVAHLTRDCQPATFGYMGMDVLDETYRKAGKMDTSQFCTSFCPYETGIVDAVAQILRPRMDESEGEVICGVRAELYKLNASCFVTTIGPELIIRRYTRPRQVCFMRMSILQELKHNSDRS